MPLVRGLLWSLLPLIVLSAGDLAAQSQRRAGIAVLPAIGLGTLNEANATSTRPLLLLVGASLEVPIAARVVLVPGVTFGTSPFEACAGGCTTAAWAGELAVLWRATDGAKKWGVLMGPSLGWYPRGDARAGVGAQLSVGAVRGVGPRFTVRAHTLTGAPSTTSVTGLLALRLSR